MGPVQDEYHDTLERMEPQQVCQSYLSTGIILGGFPPLHGHRLNITNCLVWAWAWILIEYTVIVRIQPATLK